VTREQLVRLIRVTVVAGIVIVTVGVLAVVVGVFDPSPAERARGYVEREYDATLGDCHELGGERLVCDLERPSPELLDKLGRPARARVCLFVFGNASVVLDGYAPCRQG
jgi:hypothetical protein